MFFTVLQAIKRKHAADVSRIIDSMWVLTVNNLFISANMGNIQIRETYFVAYRCDCNRRLWTYKIKITWFIIFVKSGWEVDRKLWTFRKAGRVLPKLNEWEQGVRGSGEGPEFDHFVIAQKIECRQWNVSRESLL